jgi:dTDP-4-dehydrorhamnose reductase
MKKKILILGANGLLGNSMLKYFCSTNLYSVACTVRDSSLFKKIKVNKNLFKLYENVDANKQENFEAIFEKFTPDIVINCIGIIKQNQELNDQYQVIKLNSLLPHYLAQLSKVYSARFIHFSTDCIFSGNRGNYNESDTPDATDFYGKSKLLGEINHPNMITVRTSIIGHELNGAKSLLEWFLSQNKNIKGFNRFIFTGFPSNEIARIIDKYVIPNSNLNGIYHVSSDPISKFDLLLLVNNVYSKNIKIIPDERIKIDRSLDSSLFRKLTGFKPKSWSVMIREMKNLNDFF